MTEQADVGQYYDTVYSGYSLGWSPQYFHFGFWDEDTMSHEESLINTIRYVTEFLDVKDGDRVLDAGCGVGSASRYIAKRHDVTLMGIMNSQVLLEQARKFKNEFEYPNRINFELMDYNDTDFADHSFTKIFGLESVCYAEDKAVFASEMYRILKPGGRIVIADGYRLRDDLNEEEEEIYQDWLQGWMLPDITLPSDFEQILESTGFDRIEYHDMTTKIEKSSKRMYNQTRFTRFIQYLLMKLRLNDPINYYSTRSGYLQRFLVERDIIGYGILVAEKPKA